MKKYIKNLHLGFTAKKLDDIKPITTKECTAYFAFSLLISFITISIAIFLAMEAKNIPLMIVALVFFCIGWTAFLSLSHLNKVSYNLLDDTYNSEGKYGRHILYLIEKQDCIYHFQHLFIQRLITIENKNKKKKRWGLK